MSIFILNLDYRDGNIQKILSNYGIKEYEDRLEQSLLHSFYRKIVESQVLKQNGVNYVSLTKNGFIKGYHKTLKAQNILTFMRMDTVHIMSGAPAKIDPEDFKYAKEQGAVGAKIVMQVDNLEGLDMNINIVFNYAYQAKRNGLLPVFEFRVSKHWMDKSDREKALAETLFEKLHKVLFNCVVIFSAPEEKDAFAEIKRFEIVKAVCLSDNDLDLTTSIEKIKENTTGKSLGISLFKDLDVKMSEAKFKETLVNNLAKVNG